MSQIQIIAKSNGVEQALDISSNSGETVVIKPKKGAIYEFKDLATGRAPEEVAMTRKGKNLLIKFKDNPTDNGQGEPDVVIEGFYDQDDIRLVGLAEDGQLYQYVPHEGDVSFLASNLADGVTSFQSLGYGMAVPAASGLAPWVLPLAAGLAALGAAALLAGNDDDGRSGPVPPTTPTAKLAPESDSGIKGDNITNDTTPTINGTGKPGDQITVVMPGTGETVTTTVKPDGTWNVTPTKPIPDGPGKVTVTETGPDGKDSPTVEVPIIIDTAVPAKPDAKLDPASDSGVKGDGITNDTTPTIVGTGEPGATVKVTMPGTGEVLTTIVKPDGTWNVTPTQPIADGTKGPATVTQTDPAGNTSPANDVPLQIDTTKPTMNDPILLDDVGNVKGTIENGMTTDDTVPTYSGKVSSPDVDYVNVYDNGKLIGSTTVNPDGTWKFEPATPLSPGNHSFTAEPVDKAGNVGDKSAPDSFIIEGTPNTGDPLAPAITRVVDDKDPIQKDLQKNEHTNDTLPTIHGTGQPGAVVTVTIDGKVVGSATVAADKSWSVQTTEPLTDGLHNVIASQKDAAGQSSPDTGKFPFTVDTQAPADSAFKGTDDVGLVTGDIAQNSTIDDSTPTFTNTKPANPGDIIKIYDKGQEIGSTTVDQNGNWTFTPGTPLSPGQHAITTTATDLAGNTSSPSGPLNFNIDTSAVIVDIVAAKDNVLEKTNDVGDGGLTNDDTPELIGTATANATVTIKEGTTTLGTAIADAQGNWSFQLGKQSEGLHTYSATATNAAGVTATDNFKLNIDLTDSAVPNGFTVWDDVGKLQGQLNHTDHTDDTQPTIKGTGTPGDIINVYLNGGTEPVGSAVVLPDGTWSFTPEKPGLKDGLNTIQLTSLDPAGNESDKTAPFELTIDVVGPDTTTTKIDIDPITADSIVTSAEAAGNVTVTGKLTGVPADAATKEVIVTINGVGYTATVANDNTWSVSVPGSGLVADDDKTVDAVANFYDKAGNPNSPSVSDKEIYTVAGVAPAAPVITHLVDDKDPIKEDLYPNDHTNDNLPLIVGTGQPGAIVTVTIDGKVVGSATVAADKSWSVQTTEPLTDGLHNVIASQKDAAGQSSPDTGKFPFTVDTQAPADSAFKGTDDVGLVTGDIAQNSTIDDSTPTFTNTKPANPGDIIKIYDKGQEIGSTTVDQNGNWTFTPGTPLSPGQHAITTTATDLAGNTSSPSGPLNFNIDTSAVIVDIVAAKDNVLEKTNDVGDGGLTNDDTPELIGTATANATVTIKEGTTTLGTAIADAQGNWSFQLGKQSEGLHTYSATATNAAGVTATDNFKLNIDLTDSAVPNGFTVWDDVGKLQGQLNHTDHTDDTQPTIKGTGTPGDIINVYLNGGTEPVGSAVVLPDGTWSFTPEKPGLKDGLNTIQLTSLDPAGNESDKTAPFELTIDVVGPDSSKSVLEILTVAGDNVVNTSEASSPDLLVTGKLTNIPADAVTKEVIVTVGTTDYVATVNPDGTWSAKVPGSALIADSDKLVDAKAVFYDKAGNPSVPLFDNQSYTIDGVVGITVAINTIAGDDVLNKEESTQTHTITGTLANVPADAKSTSVSIEIGNQTYIATVTGNTWAVNNVPGSVLAQDTEVTATATYVSAAGSVSNPANATRPYGVDTVPPNTTGIQLTIDNVTSDNILNAAESKADVTLTGKLTNVPADAVSKEVLVNVNGKDYVATVTGDTWTVQVPGSELAKDTGPDVKATATFKDAAGNISAPVNADKPYTVDTTTNTLSVAIEVIAGDDVLNKAESEQGTVRLTGTVGNVPTDAKSTNVTVNVNGKDYVATVTGDKWYADVPGSELAKDTGPDVTATATYVSASGNLSNPANAQRPYTVDVIPPNTTGIQLTIDSITTDDIINAAEATATHTLTGKLTNVPADAVSKEVVVYVADQSYIATVTGDTWTVSNVPGSVLAQDTGPDVKATAIFKDAAGNISAPVDAVRPYTVDTVPPNTAGVVLDIDPITGDNLLSNTEAGAPVKVTGTLKNVPADAEIKTVIVTINGNTYTATVTGETWSVDVPGAELKADPDTQVEASASLTDKAGNVSAAIPASENYDLLKLTTTGSIVSFTDDADLGAKDAKYQYTALTQGSVSNDSTPTLKGTADKDSVVLIKENGLVIGSVTADASGNWSFTMPTTSEGAHRVTIEGADATTGAPKEFGSWAFDIDLTPANVGVSINRGDLLSGKTESGALVTVVNSKGVPTFAVADEYGNWSMSVQDPNSANSRLVNPLGVGEVGTITVTDRAGNISVSQNVTGRALEPFNSIREVVSVNDYKPGDQINPSVAVLKNGTVVFTWQSDDSGIGGANVQDGSGAGVYMQIFDASMQYKIGTEQMVNVTTQNRQINPQVEALSDGSYVIVWESADKSTTGNANSVYVRHYSAQGVALSPEILVAEGSTGTLGFGGVSNRAPSVTALENGGYVVSWTRESESSPGVESSNVVYQTTFTNKDVPVVENTIVANSDKFDRRSEMDTFSSGAYVTVYEEDGTTLGDDGWDVFVQLRDAKGNVINGTPIAIPITGDQDSSTFPDVKVMTDDSFVVTYSAYNSATNRWDVHVAHYKVTDWITGTVEQTPAGDFIANTYTSGDQYNSVVVKLQDGGYMVFWNSQDSSLSVSQDGDATGVFGQRFSANDEPVGREFLVNVNTAGHQGNTYDNNSILHLLDADLMLDGNVVVTWQHQESEIHAVVVDKNQGFFSEERVNTNINNNQRNPSTTYLPNGEWVVVWESQNQDGSGYGIFGQRFDNLGYKKGPEFQINTTVVQNDQLNTSVTTLKDGDFVVTWQADTGAAITGGKQDQIYMRRYNPDGSPDASNPTMLTSEVLVNTKDTYNQSKPEVTALNDGGWMIVWQSDDGGLLDREWNIRAQRYTATGAKNGAEMIIAQGSIDQDTPSVTTLANGNVVTVWEHDNGLTNTNREDVHFSIHNPATGATLVTDRIALQGTDGMQHEPSVTALNNGNFVITWTSATHPKDQDSSGIVGRIYDATGNPVSDEFLVNTTTPGTQKESVVVQDPKTGGFVVLWESASDPAPGSGTYGIYMQAYDKDGHKVGQEMVVQQLVYGDQVDVDATFITGGQLYVTWTDKGVGDNSGDAIKGRVIDVTTTTTSLNAASAVGPVNTYTTNNQENPSITTLTGGNQVVTWQSYGQDGFSNGVYMQLFDPTGTLKLGREKLVAQTTDGGQFSSQVEALTDGSYVVVWQSDSVDGASFRSSVFVRHFSSSGVPLSDEILVSPAVTGVLGVNAIDKVSPSVTALADGGYVVSWTAESYAAAGIISNRTVYQTLYNSSDKVVSKDQIVSSADDYVRYSEMDSFSDGKYVTVWEQDNNDAFDDGWDLFVQLHAANGNKLNGIPISIPTSGTQSGAPTGTQSLLPDVKVLKDDSFVVTYQAWDDNTQRYNVHVVHYVVTDWALGTVEQKPSGDFIANTYTGGDQTHPVVVNLDDGGYMVFWASIDTSIMEASQDGDQNGIFAQRYDANDRRVGREIQINYRTNGDQGRDEYASNALHSLDATLMKDGNVHVTWESSTIDGAGWGIESQVVKPDDVFHSEERVNTSVKDAQDHSSTTYLPGGGWVVVWQSNGQDGSEYGIYAQIFEPNGDKKGPEFRVNNVTDRDQTLPQVVTLADGDFLITWQSWTPSGATIPPQAWDIMMRRYNADGSVDATNPAMLAGEVKVNTTNSEWNQMQPAVTALKDGGWVIAWDSNDVNGEERNVVMQHYNKMGQLVGTNTVVAGGDPDQDTPTLTTLANGNVVIAWEHYNGTFSTNQDDVHFSIYNPTTKQIIVADRVASQSLAEAQRLPSVTALKNGNFVMTWNSLSAADNDENGVIARIFDATGNPVTDEFLVNTIVANDQSNSVVISNPNDGGFVVLWQSEADPAPGAGTYGIYAQAYDASGNRRGQEIKVNQVVYGQQIDVSASFTTNGDMIVSWTDNGVGDYDSSAVKERLLDIEQIIADLANQPIPNTGTTPDGIHTLPYTEPTWSETIVGTSGHDVLDARYAKNINAGAGDDVVVINSTNFTSANGGAGTDTLVWDSYLPLNLKDIAAKTQGFEVIRFSDTDGTQTNADNLTVSYADIVAISDTDVLRIESTNQTSGDTVNISNGAAVLPPTEVTLNGIVYNSYNLGGTAAADLLIQQGIAVNFIA